jgi:hypothetical protein
MQFCPLPDYDATLLLLRNVGVGSYLRAQIRSFSSAPAEETFEHVWIMKLTVSQATFAPDFLHRPLPNLRERTFTMPLLLGQPFHNSSAHFSTPFDISSQTV